MTPPLPITKKAEELWAAMDPSERHGIRFGLFPATTMEAAAAEGYDEHELSIALMAVASAQGGIIG
jgi:hypothetical protein